MLARRTLAGPASLAGVGLHTGAPATLTLRPGAPGSGVVFRRTDLPESQGISATADAVTASERRTVLGAGAATVSTVEHLLAAVIALEIDDLLVELDGPEVPALDGSAAPFAQAIREAGTVTAVGDPDPVIVNGTIELSDGDAVYEVGPAARLTLDVTVEWDHPLIGRQRGTFEIDPSGFERDLAPARTFGFADEGLALAEQRLARGASPANALVLTEDGVLGGPLRWPDEFVRHKALDLLGDLALLGRSLRAAVTAYRPSHHGNLTLVRAIGRMATCKEQPR